MESEVQHLLFANCFMKRSAQGQILSVDMTASQAGRGRTRMWRYDPGIYGSNMISENCFVLCMPMILSGIRK